MGFSKMTLPPKDFTITDCRMSEFTPGTFANKFHALLSKYEKQTVTTHSNKDVSDYSRTDSACDAANSHF